MAKLSIPNMRVRTRRHGICYSWEPSPRLRASGWTAISFGPDEQAAIDGCRARNREVAAWRNGGTRPAEVAPRIRSSTVQALARRFASDHLAHQSPNHYRNSISHLAEIERLFGDIAVDELQPHHVHGWRDRMLGEGQWTRAGPQVARHTAHNRLRTLRALYNWAMKPAQRLARTNPAEGFDMPAPRGRHQIWERDDEGAFIATANDLGLPIMALAMRLAIYTGQRSGDLIHMTEHQLVTMELMDDRLADRFAGKDGQVKGWDFSQSKTGTPMLIPFDPDMRDAVERAIAANRARDRAATPPRLVTYILVNPNTGQPWSERAFIKGWNHVLAKAIERTGRTAMAELQWRDLRRTRVVRLQRQGMDKHLIGSITGHSPKSIDAMLAVYGPHDATKAAHAIAAAQDHETTATARRAAKKG